MARRTRDTIAILRTIERNQRRSSLFWWLLDHHDDMVQAAQAGRINWTAFCIEAAHRGLTDTKGAVPTPENGRKTWSRVRRAVAEARQRQAAKPPPRPGSVYPSRMPKNVRPVSMGSPQGGALDSVTGPRASVPSRTSDGEGGVPPSASSGTPAESGEMTEHAKRQFEQVDKAFARHDKRFRF